MKYEPSAIVLAFFFIGLGGTLFSFGIAVALTAIASKVG